MRRAHVGLAKYNLHAKGDHELTSDLFYSPFSIASLCRAYNQHNPCIKHRQITLDCSSKADPENIVHHSPFTLAEGSNVAYSMHDYRSDRYFFKFIIVAFDRILRVSKTEANAFTLKKSAISKLKWATYAKILGFRALDFSSSQTSFQRLVVFLNRYSAMQARAHDGKIRVCCSKHMLKVARKNYSKLVHVQRYPQLSSAIKLSKQSKARASILRKRKNICTTGSTKTSDSNTAALLSEVLRLKEEVIKTPDSLWTAHRVRFHEYVEFVLASVQSLCTSAGRSKNVFSANDMRTLQSEEQFFLNLKSKLPSLTLFEYLDLTLKSIERGGELRIPYTRKQTVDLLTEAKERILNEKAHESSSTSDGYTEKLAEYEKLISHMLSECRSEGLQNLMEDLDELKCMLEESRNYDGENKLWVKIKINQALSSVKHMRYRITLKNQYLDSQTASSLKQHEIFLKEKRKRFVLTFPEQFKAFKAEIETVRDFTNPFMWGVNFIADKALTLCKKCESPSEADTHRAFFEDARHEGFDSKCFEYLHRLREVLQQMDKEKIIHKSTWINSNVTEALAMIKLKWHSISAYGHQISDENRAQYQELEKFFVKFKAKVLVDVIVSFSEKTRAEITNTKDGVSSERTKKFVEYAAWSFAKLDSLAERFDDEPLRTKLEEHRQFFRSTNEACFDNVYWSKVSRKRPTERILRNKTKEITYSAARALVQSLQVSKSRIKKLENLSTGTSSIEMTVLKSRKHIIWYQNMQTQVPKESKSSLGQDASELMDFFYTKQQDCLRNRKHLKNLEHWSNSVNLLRNAKQACRYLDKKGHDALSIERACELVKKIPSFIPERDLFDGKFNLTRKILYKAISSFKESLPYQPFLQGNNQSLKTKSKRNDADRKLATESEHKKKTNEKMLLNQNRDMFLLLSKLMDRIRAFQKSSKDDRAHTIQVHATRAVAMDIMSILSGKVAINKDRKHATKLHYYKGFFGSIKGWVEPITSPEKLKVLKVCIRKLGQMRPDLPNCDLCVVRHFFEAVPLIFEEASGVRNSRETSEFEEDFRKIARDLPFSVVHTFAKTEMHAIQHKINSNKNSAQHVQAFNTMLKNVSRVEQFCKESRDLVDKVDHVT